MKHYLLSSTTVLVEKLVFVIKKMVFYFHIAELFDI